jgi:transposase, IS30 family
MGEGYRQLSYEERCTIARLREAGQSLQKIAAAMDRSASTISRELKRNTGTTKGYDPVDASDQAWARRWRGMRLDRDDALREAVLAGLAANWSPEQVSGRLAREAGCKQISPETIYRFIYAQMKRTNNSRWRLYLPRAKARRGWRAKPGGSPASFIKNRRPLGERPQEAELRNQPGHWEADYMLFAKYGQNVLVLHERQTRFTILDKPPHRKAKLTAQRIRRKLHPLPQALRKTISFDNGTEFAEHHRLHRTLGVQTFFCDVASPWQKGGVENTIGRLRAFLPRKTNLNAVSHAKLRAYANLLNNTPRKCLDFKTPAEACSDLLLHFKCESTSRLSSG